MVKKNIKFLIISWLMLFAGYLLYADKLGSDELLAGSIASCGAALLFLYAHMPRQESFRPVLKWFVPVWRLPWAIVWESWLILTALVRRIRGRHATGVFIDFPFTGKKGTGRSAALISFMTYGVCVSPNSYVIMIDQEKKKVLVRQLVGRKLSVSDKCFLELK